jgi:hypothetical protein
MNYRNHPFFFPLLKKLLIVSVIGENKDTISKIDKEKIYQSTNDISWVYFDKFLTKQVYTTGRGQSSVGKSTLNKLVKGLPNEWEYGTSWDSFYKQILKDESIKELLNLLPQKDYDDMASNYQNHIKEKIEQIAQEHLASKTDKTIERPSIIVADKRKIKTPLPIPKPSNERTKTISWKTVALCASFLGLLTIFAKNKKG